MQEGGILQQAKPGALAIDMTTSSPALAVRLYEEGKKKGSRVVDAPVSGGDSGARNGTLYVRTNTGIGLNLRNAPSTEGDIITSFKPGTQVKVLKRGNGWHYVSVNGKEGYMSSKFLSAYNVSYTKPVKSFTATLKNINGGSVVNFRLYPGMKTKIIGVYPVGTKVTVLEMGDNWSKVEIDGKTGYVSTYFLKY